MQLHYVCVQELHKVLAYFPLSRQEFQLRAGSRGTTIISQGCECTRSLCAGVHQLSRPGYRRVPLARYTPPSLPLPLPPFILHVSPPPPLPHPIYIHVSPPPPHPFPSYTFLPHLLVTVNRTTHAAAATEVPVFCSSTLSATRKSRL